MDVYPLNFFIFVGSCLALLRSFFSSGFVGAFCGRYPYVPVFGSSGLRGIIELFKINANLPRRLFVPLFGLFRNGHLGRLNLLESP